MMRTRDRHPYIPVLREQLADGDIDRREFLRTATLLGLSAGAAYAMAGKIAGDTFLPPAHAAETPVRGGTLRCSMQVQEMTDPASFGWIRKSNVARQFLEYVTITGPDNITRPYLAESWDVSDDLKTWTFKLRKGIRWSNGEALVADHVLYNIERWMDPATGSSMPSLLGAMTREKSDGFTEVRRGAVEKLDDHTFRLNLDKPELAIPEAFYHYPAAIMHPASVVDGEADISRWPIGTGPFRLTSFEVGSKVVLERNPGYWGGPDSVAGSPYLDRIVYLDHGDDPAAKLSALASNQVDLLLEITLHQIELAQQLPDVTLYETVTAQTGIARMQVDKAPFSDRRVRKAIQACVDHEEMLRLAYAGRGAEGEDHHCAPIHPEYAELPKQRQNYQRARALLAEAGYSDGLKLSLDINGAEPWETDAAQVLAQMLRPAGISLDLNIMPGSLYWDIWDQTPFGITGWTHRPLGVMVYNLAYTTGAPWNETHFADPEFDRLLAEANGKINPAERRETMAKLEKILQDSGIMVQVLWRSIFTAGRKNLRNFQLHPTQYHQFFMTWLA